MKVKTILVTTLFLFTACNIVSNTNDNLGEAFLVFKLPNSSFSIKNIPDNTDYLEISITGVGLENANAIKKTVKKSEADKKGEIKLKLKNLPVGSKLVSIQAFDSKKKLLAEGKENVTIISGKITSVTIELKESTLPITKESPKTVTISPSPVVTITPKESSFPEVPKEDLLTIKFTNIQTDNTVIIAQLKDSNGRLFKGQFFNSNINFSGIPTGTTTLKATILSSVFLPLGKFEKEFIVEKGNKNLEFEAQKATLKDVFEFDESTTTNLKSKIAITMKSIFNEYIFPDQDNTNALVIKESNVELFIDGKPYLAGNDFVITPNSSIKVNIKQNSTNLKYVWAVTRYLPLRKIYQTSITSDRANFLNLKLVTNLKDIHVFATDLKTMSNVVDIPIEQFTK